MVGKNLVYAGIGARETPFDVLLLMVSIGEALARRGWTLRSGCAEGADSAFEVGAARGEGAVELYLPWPDFHLRRLAWAESMGWAKHLQTELVAPQIALERATEKATQIAAQLHPGWTTMKPTHRPLHARNSHQVLGADCASPARFVLCWTPDGAVEKTTAATGGTGQAIRCAARYGCPVFNLRRDDHRARVERMLTEAT